MFGLGIPELLLILVIGLVIFGPGKLADSGKALAKSVREFRAAASEKEEPKKIGDSRAEKE
ncbi:MAG: twin-arginine translocase TatA/TatE family subunit [Schwartzia sp.]|nr:twin-arginine translocase TatA/TatE family subunit [Schwartzia sp. (in: firmicutes)]